MDRNSACPLRECVPGSMEEMGASKISFGRFLKWLLPREAAGAVTTARQRFEDVANRIAAQEPVASVLRLRLQRIATRVLGRANRPARSRIEIDITYDCNQGCLHCDRSCLRAPSKESMTLDQIRRFIQESLDQGIHWEQIAVLGGEPTMHPNLFEILDLLLDYRRNHAPWTRLILKTHGNGRQTQAILERIPSEVILVNSAKQTHSQDYFMAFNVAPRDREGYRTVDFTNGCPIPEKFGLGLGPYGYYACAVMGGGIDRIFGFDMGRKNLPAPEDPMFDQMRTLCPFCGHFLRKEGIIRYTNLKQNELSPTWQKAYQHYRENPPVLQRY